MRVVKISDEVIRDRYGDAFTYEGGMGWTYRRAVVTAMEAPIPDERLDAQDRQTFDAVGRAAARMRAKLADRIHDASDAVELTAEEEAMIVRRVYAAYIPGMAERIIREIEREVKG